MAKKIIKVCTKQKVFKLLEDDLKTIHYLQLGFIPPIPKFETQNAP